MIAAHYVAAHEALPDADDAAEIRTRARDALTRAGERATALAASAEAHRYFRRAAELAEAPAAQATLLDRAGQAALLANLPVEGRVLLERAHALLFEEAPETAALVSARLADLDYQEGHAPQAVARLEAALEALAGVEPDAHVAAVAGQLGRFLVLSGEGRLAEPHIEQALEIAERLALPEVLSHALNTKGASLAVDGHLNEARILLEGALAIALEHDLHSAALRAYNNLAWVLELQDRIPESYALAEEALALARRVGDRGQEIVFGANGVYAHYLGGRWDEAVARAEEFEEAAITAQTQLSLSDVVFVHTQRGQTDLARAWWSRLTAEDVPEDPQGDAAVRGYEAHVLRAEGKLRDALSLVEGVFTRVEGQIALQHQHVKLAAAEALECALALGDTAKAEDVLAVLEGLQPGELTPFYRGLRARFRGRLETGPAAAAYFREAEAVYEALGAPFFLAVTQLEHAESLGPSHDAETLRAAAREVFARLGATPWLERAEGLTAGERPAAVPA
jgi:tetratricopeptide (TPR) repeat protein